MPFVFSRMSLLCHSYVTRMYSYIILMSLSCTRMSSECHSHVLVCHRYVTRMHSYVICVSLVCTRMPSACHSYVLVCHPYVSCMYSYVIRMSLECGWVYHNYYSNLKFKKLRFYLKLC